MFHYLYYLLLVDQFPVSQPSVNISLDYFWQIIATIFGGILLWLFKRDLAKRDKREEKITEAITTLQTHFHVLSSEVEHIRKDLDQIIENRE